MATSHDGENRADGAVDARQTSFAVIIEWENAKLSELGRARRMLGALSEQTRSLDRNRLDARDLIILYDLETIERSQIATTVANAMDGDVPFSDCKIIPVSGKRYYELKNFGSTLTAADLVIFLDSDVIPEPGWLPRLLDVLHGGEVDVVAGSTYVTLESLYSRSFALFWFFPLRTPGDSLRESETFFANNVAFRRSVFAANNFPSSEKFRGQCTDLATKLRAAGIKIFLHEGARVNHPPPNGLGHFFVRALCAGHDQATLATGRDVQPSAAKAWRRFIRNVRKTNRFIRRRGDVLRLGIAERMAARCIGLGYYSIYFLGEVATLANPRLVPRLFPI
jgi:hypothetical protein